MFKHKYIYFSILLFVYYSSIINAQISTLNARITWHRPIQKNLKIKKIKRAFPDLYFIYASCNDTLYKIVSYRDKSFPNGEKLKKGKTYRLWIRSLFPDSINGAKAFPDPWGIYYGKHPVDKEIEKNIWDIYDSEQLSGNRLKSNNAIKKKGD